MKMKRTILTLAVAFSISAMFAQDLTSKKGEKYLPEAKDWAIGIDGRPFLTLLGNAANPSAKFITNDQTIVGKFYKDEKTAFRGKLRIGMYSNKDKSLVADVTSSDPLKKVEDLEKTSKMNLGLGAGIEKRKGNTRLQGFYGGEFLVSLSTEKKTYEYGNAITSTNPVASRPTEEKSGSAFSFGLRGFIGAEYFVLPKMSVGVEYGWGLALSTKGNDETTAEGWDAANSTVKTVTTETGNKGASKFVLDTDISNAAVFLMLHF